MPEGTSQPCPSCGISVMFGYVKCPKCHAPMPGAAGPRTRRGSMAGGTTSERVEVMASGASGGGGLYWVLALVAIGGGLVVWATQCRGSTRAPAPAADITDTADQPTGSGPASAAPDELPDQVAPSGPDPSFAADALEGELAGERLYATVSVIGDRLDVRSAFCTEARLGDIIGRHAEELKAAGVVRVTCSETYGTQVFERGL